MKSKILIVDDESLARERIANFLRHKPDQYECRTAEDGFAALAQFREFKPDVMFLDIEMPELSGFDVVRELGEVPGLKIIFQTAYDQFAIRAFEVNACDYLLKPFTDERLQQALDKACTAQPLGFPTATSEGTLKLSAYLTGQRKYLDRFVIKAGARIRLLEEAQILYFTREDHETRLFADQIDYVYEHSLDYLEQHLNPARFIRIHRNCIVRADQVQAYSRDRQMTITLKNGTTLKASREGAKRIKCRFEES